jgi:hypothetical protein
MRIGRCCGIGPAAVLLDNPSGRIEVEREQPNVWPRLLDLGKGIQFGRCIHLAIDQFAIHPPAIAFADESDPVISPGYELLAA